MTSGSPARPEALAFVTPLPPEPTGVADYSAGLLPPLARRFDLVAFTKDPARSRADSGFVLRGYRDFDPAAGTTAIYQLGNHARHHAAIYRLALDRPGIAVLHEHVLHDLVRDCALASGGEKAFAEELRYCLGPTGERLAATLATNEHRPPPFRWPLFERVVDSSLAVIVHNRAARDRIARSRPLARVRVVPHWVAPPADSSAEAAALRHRLAIPRDALLLGAFGVAADPKRVDVALSAFARLTRAHPQSFFLLVGPGAERFAREHGPTLPELAPRLRTLDRVPLATLEAAMAATDIAFNLRFPTGGETSGTCLRLLALGRAVLVTDTGWFAEIPDSCCVKVAPDALEEAMLDAVLDALAARPDLRRALGENGRRWALAEHSVEAAVEGYAALVAEVAAEPRLPVPPQPPLAPHSRDDVDIEIVKEVAAALGDLGVTEADREILERVAHRIAELGSPASARGRPT